MNVVWPHPENCCEHMGAKLVEGTPIDFYRCEHGGVPVYTARYGPLPEDIVSVPAAALWSTAITIRDPILDHLLLIYLVDIAPHGSLAQGFALLARPSDGEMIMIINPLVSETELEAIEAAAATVGDRLMGERFESAVAVMTEAAILGKLRATGLKRWAKPFVDISHMAIVDPEGPECPPAGAMEGTA